MRIRWRNLELPTRVQIDPNSRSDTYARFAAEPFERGFGTTIGNSLRRILLSSLEGTAVTAVQIKGVSHEFSTMKGILEDVTEIMLNLKKLRVRMHGEGPATLQLVKSSPGDVTAADITCDQITEVVDPAHHIATITSGEGALDMTMTVKRGRGYLTEDENSEGNREPNMIYLASSFSPVIRVRFNTENTRVGKITNYDKLVLDVWTDGTVSPELAVVEAAKIMRKHINPFVQLTNHGPALPDADPVGVSTANLSESELVVVRSKLAMPVSELDLPVRATNCFEAENIRTLGDLCVCQESDILNIRNFGKTSLNDVKKKLADMGLSFGMDRGLLEGLQPLAPEGLQPLTPA